MTKKSSPSDGQNRCFYFAILTIITTFAPHILILYKSDMQQIINIIQGTPRKPEWRMAKPVDFHLNEGEHIAIYGPNGCGKSMLVDIITGRHPLLHNQAFYDFAPSRKPYISDNIRLVTFRDSYGESDSTYFLQQRWNQQEIDEETPTVGQLLFGQHRPDQNGETTGLTIGKDTEDSTRFLAPLFDTPIILLSSGELRKFQLAKALLANPRVLIIDNPYIGLDTEARTQLTETLEQLVKNHPIQVILVVSRREDIPTFITRVVELDKNAFHSAPVHTATHTALPDEEEGAAEDGGDTPLVFRNVTIAYGKRTILKNLNWTVNRGEHWAVKGPNGSGKSTLLSLVCADNPQGYAADITLFGHRRGTGESIWDIKRHIGYVSPEMHRAYRHNLPTIDIVASGLKDTVGLYVRPTAEEKKRCARWMEVFGIGHLTDRPFLLLSSGEQRLALLARAFVKQPDLLILDEPLHGLDDRNREHVKTIIDDYCSSPSRTLIMVSHYDNELPECIDHTLQLKRN